MVCCPACSGQTQEGSRYCSWCGDSLSSEPSNAETVTDTCSPTRTSADDDPDRGHSVDDRGLVAGQLIAGRYRIVESIGQGGMGEVWLAQQEAPVRRKVAFKVIKLGMDTQQIVTRFEAERQALAMMDHPAVAKVFDAGFTPGGRPFFVMEYVTGVPITRFCDDQRLTTRERLKLYQQVCGGVQHAHHKTIIHRDLKPSNVLVTQQDGEPLPKIIDFGIAKAMGQQPGDETMHTQLGVIMGTPEYMSPEQALGEDVDTRTDVYALGVMLYEMLVGELPFESKGLREQGYDSIRRKICEEDPLRPSSRFRSLDDGRSSGLAKSRQTDPSAMQRDLKGDLDWITMKTLEKDRARRYTSPAELAADVQRHLDHLPVSARQPSVRYRTGKFVRRHRWGVAAGSLLCLALIAGTIGTALGLVRATHETRKARAVTDHLVSILSEANPEKAQGRSVTVQEAMDASSQKVAESFEDQPLLEMQVRATMALVYHEMGSYDAAEDHLRRVALLAERELGPRDKFTLDARGKLGRTLMDAGRLDEAEVEMRTLLPVYRDRYGDEHKDTLSLVHNLAAVYLHQKRYDQAEPLLRDAAAGRREVLGEEHTDTQASVGNLAQLYMFTERYDEAEPLLREGLIVRRRKLGDQHPRTLISVFNLGDLYHRMGRNAEAEGLMREALKGFRKVVGEHHPYTLETLGGLAGTLLALDRLGEVEELALESYRLRHARFGADHPLTIEAAALLVQLYERTGRGEEAARFRR